MTYAEREGEPLQLHIFEPDRPSGTALLWFHGGGWQAGEPEQLYPQCRYLAGLGFTAISAEYRLATEGRTLQDSVQDARAALAWLAANAAAIAIDPARIVVGGESAGGHLAAMAALSGTGTEKAPAAAAQILVNPVLDLTSLDWAMRKPGVNGDRKTAKILSPLHRIDAQSAPVLLLHGGRDEIVQAEQAKAYAEALQAAGVPAKLRVWPDRGHAFFLDLPGKRPDREAMGKSYLEIEAFLRSTGLSPESSKFQPLHLFDGADGWRSFSELVVVGDRLLGSTFKGGDADAGTVFSYDPALLSHIRLHSFRRFDGREPFTGFAVDGDTLYGVAKFGGRQSVGGTLYAINSDGTGFRVLHEFTAPSTEGFYPHAAPILHENFLYGTTYHGGEKRDGGVLYRYSLPDGPFEALHGFTPETGRHPTGQLTVVDGWLYGTTSDLFRHEEGQYGTLFRFHPGKRTFEVLHRFEGGDEGAHPYDHLSHFGDEYLYGTTYGEIFNPTDKGTVFRYHLETGEHEVLHAFDAHPGTGSKPNGGLVEGSEGAFLYGFAHGSNAEGGDEGTLFRLRKNGRDFEVLHRFTGGLAGNTPMRSPVVMNGYLYGTCVHGGLTTEKNPASGGGMIFRYALTE
ncbi:MAG: alpha/beta hydrolase fold domain-containing protein [Verrucomicrobia bacterium]|nr:alpha/beta hydrolase fold domain-containing protein [Verrucomicrobiota bacterium]